MCILSHYFISKGVCSSKVTGGNCSLIGLECWCFFSTDYSGREVCGYLTGYEGKYYSLTIHSLNSPYEIIQGLGLQPGDQSCKTDTAADCQGDAATNICYAKGCTGTSLTSSNDGERWKRQTGDSTAILIHGDYKGGIVRCVNMEGNIYKRN